MERWSLLRLEAPATARRLAVRVGSSSGVNQLSAAPQVNRIELVVQMGLRQHQQHDRRVDADKAKQHADGRQPEIREHQEQCAQQDFEPGLGDEIARETFEAKQTLAKAFTKETLRLNQAERLMRRATEEFTFDGFLVPRHSVVRLCIWESHKDPAVFETPFDFRAERFLQDPPNNRGYAPFGMDHHICPFSELNVHAGVLFLSVLAQNYRVELISDGPVRRGHTNWRTSYDFAVRLLPR